MTDTTRADFDALLGAAAVIPVVRTLFADGETPVGVFRKLAANTPGTFLLESAEQGGIWSRYSFVGAASFGLITQRGDAAEWIDLGLDAARALGALDGIAPLEAVRALHERWSAPGEASTAFTHGLPLTGGLVGFIGWDAVRQIERLPDAPPTEVDVPGQALSFVADLVALDHKLGTVHLVANALNDGVDDADALWADAQARLDSMQARLAQPAEAVIERADFTAVADVQPRTSADDYMAAVERSKEYVREGDVFQVVISQRFDAESTASPLDVYRVLRTLNPSPYMYLLNLQDTDGKTFHIVGSSPEALVKIADGRALMHPIAGSRPRGATPETDNEFAAELLADPKERAEHLMLVDLARNDLAKVCRPGTVEVTEFMRVERFSHIMHIVSSVEGNVRTGVSPVDVFRATFPAGTLSGAPKPRALQIIDELEPVGRGVYGGVVGYFSFSGDADLAIAIRTATIVDGTAFVQAGAGIVADSVPALEQQEVVNKAAAPLRAIAIANTLRRVE